MVGQSAATALMRGLLLLPFCLWSVSVIGFWLGVPLTTYHLWVGLLGFGLIQKLFFYSGRWNYLVGLATPLLWLAISVAFQSTHIDFSADGRQYHQEAIIQLTRGLNPIWEAIEPDVWDISWAVWINTLPKFGWISGAVVAKAVNSIESAKWLTLYAIPGIVVAGFICARRGFGAPIWLSILSGTVVSLNPIAAAQLCTNYSDGYAACFAAIGILTFAEYLRSPNSEVEYRLIIASVLAISAKYTNFYPTLFLGLLLVGWGTWKWGAAILATRVAKLSLAAIVLGFLLNPNPYVSNLWRYGNINYPMSGKKFISFGHVGWASQLGPEEGVENSIYSAHLPLNFTNKNRVEQFFYSLFSRPEHVAFSDKTGATLRLPWEATDAEWSYLSISDGRIASLGPLFALLFLFSAFALSAAARREPILLLFSVALLVAALANPFGWWMRYIGFFYTFIFFGILACGQLRHRWVRRVSVALFAAVAIGNSLPIFLKHLQHAKRHSIAMMNQFTSERDAQGFAWMEAYFGGTRGYLNEQNILYLTKKIEVRMADAHLLNQTVPCIRSWPHWFDRSQPHEPQDDDPRRRNHLFNLLGQYQLREGLSPSQLREAAACYSEISLKKYRTVSLWNRP